MENLPAASPLCSGSSMPITIAPVAGQQHQQQHQAANKQYRLNLTNQNFILVPASASGNLTAALASGGQAAANVTNLIATHQNNLMNKGKIMIITPGPHVLGNAQLVASSVSAVGSASLTSIDVASNLCNNQTPKPLTEPQPQTYQLLTTTCGQTVSIASNHLLTTPTAQSTVQLGQNPNNKLQTFSSLSSAPVTQSVLAQSANNSTNTPQPQTQIQPAYHQHHHHPNIILNGTAHTVDPSKASASYSVVVPTTSQLPLSQPSTSKHHQKKHRLGVISLDDLPEGEHLDRHDMEIEELNHLTAMMGNSRDPMQVERSSKRKTFSKAEAKKMLYSDEKLDRESPELWPEQVPGVVNFISGNTFPIVEELGGDSLQEILQSDQGSSNSSKNQQQSAAAAASSGSTAISGGDSGLGSGCSDSSSVKKYFRTFDFTGYGLASNILERSRNGSGDTSDSEEHESPAGVNGENCESNENSSRTSPVDGFTSHSGPIDLATPSTSKITTPAKTSAIQSAQVVKSKPAPAKNVPEWQRDLDEEEVAMLYGYGSLTTSALLDKVKEIQNLAYQLGLEQEREMARARFLNVLGDCRASEGLNGAICLTKRDLAFAESRTFISSSSEVVPESPNSSFSNEATVTENGSQSTPSKRKYVN